MKLLWFTNVVLFSLSYSSPTLLIENEQCHTHFIAAGNAIMEPLPFSSTIFTTESFLFQSKFESAFILPGNNHPYCINYIIKEFDFDLLHEVLLSILNSANGKKISEITILSDLPKRFFARIFERFYFGRIICFSGSAVLWTHDGSSSLLNSCDETLMHCHMDVYMAGYDPPGFMENGRGYGSEALKFLGEKNNISFSLVLDPEKSWGGLRDNGSFYGSIKAFWMRTHDVSFTGFTLMYARSKAVVYFPLEAEKMHLTSKQPGHLPLDYQAFLGIFGLFSWISVGVSVALVLFVTGNKISLLLLYRSLLAQGFNENQRVRRKFPLARNLLLAFWSFYALILSLIYLTKLTSVILVPRIEEAIDTIDDVIRLNKTIYVLMTTSVPAMLKRDYPRVLPYTHQVPVVLEETFYNKGVALKNDMDDTDFCPKSSRFYFSKDSVVDPASNWYGFIGLKNAPWSEKMHLFTLRYLEFGLFLKAQSDAYTLDWTHCHSIRKEAEPLSLSHLSIVFVILSTGLALAGLIFMIEIGLHFRYQ